MYFEEKFFEKEVREGFDIPSMMKRAWAAELEVLSVVDDICRKNHITWFADFGTLLGAVRHRGFIPWDDDIDICLRREEYQRLLKVLPQELPKGFAVAGLHATSRRLQDAARIHQLRVIADETEWSFNDYMKYFHGFPYQRIGIDIFPVDYLPRDPELAEMQSIILRYGFLTVQHWEMWKEKGELEERIQNLEEMCSVEIPEGDNRYHFIWRLLDQVSGLYQEEEADDMVQWIFYLDDGSYRVDKEAFRETVCLPFEHGMKIPVPSGYRKVLFSIYGDYMQPHRGGGDHDYPFYGHMQQELERQIKAAGFKGTVEEFCREVSMGVFTV